MHIDNVLLCFSKDTGNQIIILGRGLPCIELRKL